MNVRHQLLLGLLLCSMSAPSSATTVHRWTDENGLTHFSDAPPAHASHPVETLEIAENHLQGVDNKAEYYSIANQWQRLKAERDERNKLKLEKEKIKAAKAAALADRQAPVVPSYYQPRPWYRPQAFRNARGYGNRSRGQLDNSPFAGDRRHVKSGNGHVGGGFRNARAHRGEGRGGLSFQFDLR